MSESVVTAAPNKPPIAAAKPKDKDWLTYTYMEWLAKRFAPRLVTFPIHEPKSAPGVRTDYHPMDVRQLFGFVSSELAHESKIGIAAFFDRVGRTAPVQMLFNYAFLAGFFAWLALAQTELFKRTDDLSEEIWLGVLSVVAVAGFFASLWLIGGVLPRVPYVLIGLASVVVPVFAWFLATITGIWPDLDAIEDFLGGDSTKVILPFGLITPLLFRGYQTKNVKPDPDALLKSLKASPGEELKGSLQFIDSGSVNNREQHKKKYLEILAKPEPKYEEVAYAYVSLGNFRFEKVLAIQYWFLYFYNDWENFHESDWEQVTVYVKFDADASETEAKLAKVKPIACAFSAHDGGHIAAWEKRQMDWICDNEGGLHPVVYVAWGSHANYPKPGQYPATTNFAGLTLGGREASVVRGRTRYGYIDVTSAEVPDFVHNDDDVHKPTYEQATNIALAVIPPGIPEDDGKPSWSHICGTPIKVDACQSSEHEGLCQHNFNWLNLKGGWGDPGALFGDGAPETPCNQGAWSAFEWLTQCRRVNVGDGYQVLDAALMKP